MSKVTDIIKKRYCSMLLKGNISENAARICESYLNAEKQLGELTLSEIEGAYKWADIDYKNTDRGEWHCAEHYARILNVLTQNSYQRLETDINYREKIIGALKYWLHYDFKNPNWWHNDIGNPKNIGDITLILLPYLDSETLNKAINIVAFGSMATRSDISEKWTGTNLLWGGMNTIKHALLIEDEVLLAKAINRIGEEIKIGNEGIQQDGSFFQHGRRLYSGGYGRGFAYDIAQLTFLLQDTEYQFKKEKLDLFLTHVLDGVRYMSRGDALDMASINRELARPNAIKTGLIKKALEIMAETNDMPRKDEINAYLASINGTYNFEGTKFFSDAMMLCHHSGGVYVGAKFTSDKLWDQDSCNKEGELCYNMTYGTHTNIMRDGSEYLNILPLWDFSKIPGTTARSETDQTLQERFNKHNWCCDPLPNSHAGGKQIGEKAVIFEKAEHDGIEAFVTDFAFEGGFVSLGAGIKDEKNSEDFLVTTIDQCFKQGEIIREERSFIHHGIRYTELADTKIQCESIISEGDWKRLNPCRETNPIYGELVLITITHNEENGNKYAYMVSSHDNEVPMVKIIQNDEKVQAILTPDNMLMAVFHEKSSFVYGNKEYFGDEKKVIIE